MSLSPCAQTSSVQAVIAMNTLKFLPKPHSQKSSRRPRSYCMEEETKPKTYAASKPSQPSKSLDNSITDAQPMSHFAI